MRWSAPHEVREAQKMLPTFDDEIRLVGERRVPMKGQLTFGLVLLFVGLAVLATPMMRYTTTEKAVNLGPVEIVTEREKQVALPQTLGVVSAAAGVALIAASRRRVAA
jgi:hypothetical protein